MIFGDIKSQVQLGLGCLAVARLITQDSMSGKTLVRTQFQWDVWEHFNGMKAPPMSFGYSVVLLVSVAVRCLINRIEGLEE